jgi:hypothetical protein
MTAILGPFFQGRPTELADPFILFLRARLFFRGRFKNGHIFRFQSDLRDHWSKGIPFTQIVDHVKECANGEPQHERGSALLETHHRSDKKNDIYPKGP